MSLLEDLLREFPEFTPQRAELARILEAMERHGPPPDHPDAAFVARLRAQLLAEPAPSPSSFYSFFSFMNQRMLVPSLAALALVIVASAAGATWYLRSSSGENGARAGITRLAAGAFGDLSSATSAGVADGKGGGGAGLSAAESPSVATIDSKMMATEEFISEPYPYEPTVYVYTYTGDLASYLTDATGTVYERQTFAPPSASALASLAGSFSQLDMRPFLSGDLASFVLRADDYMLSVDATGNTWSMYKDWTSYSVPENWTPMTVEDLPSDDAIFGAAQDFVQTWGITTSAYGTPVISEPEIALARSGLSSSYVPESATVVYPLLVDGGMVYPAWGSAPTGLRITVNLRDLNVTNAYDALSQSYNASTYDLTQDADLVGKLVAGGGSMPVTYEGMAINEVTVALNDPERVLMEYSLYDNGTSRTLFVPALHFMLQDASEVPWTSGVVTVPLVKDIAETQASQGSNGGVVPFMVK